MVLSRVWARSQSPTLGASRSYCATKALNAALAAASPTWSPPVTGQRTRVIAPGGVVWKVPTSPAMVPSVQLAAAWPSTVKPAAVAGPPPLPVREKLGIALRLDAGLPDAGSLDVASLHAAPSSAVATSSPVANLE